MHRASVFFFVVAPFCSCPASLVSRIFFAVGPGCAKCCFLLRSVGRRDLSAGPEQKTNITQGVFFFAPAPKGRGRRSPVGRRHGARARKECYFALAPCRRPTGLLLPLPFGAGAKKEKTPWVVFFFCSGPVPAPNGASPSLAFCRGHSKKKHPGWCLFFAAAPRGRSLTHCGPGWRCLPSPGWCFFFLLRPRPDRGVFFFAVAPPGRSLTQLTVGWGDFGKARVVFFFLLRPRRVFLDNNKNVWGTTSGLKRPGGATAKKKTPLPFA